MTFFYRLVFTGFLMLSTVHSAAAGVSLTFWHGLESLESTKILTTKMKSFQEKSGIAVNLMHYGAADQVNSKIMTAVAANTPPNLMWWGPMNTGRMAQTGRLLKIQDLMNRDPSFAPSDIYQGLWDSGRYENDIWTFPFDANNVALYYNKDHFKAAGLDPTGLNTWLDLKAYAKALTTQHRFGLELSIGTGEWLTFSTLLPFLWQAGGQFLSDDETQVLFNSQAGIDALKFLADLVNTEKCAKWSEAGAGYKIDNFIAGRVSMIICGPWNSGALQAQNNVTYGALCLPKNKINATALGGEHLYVFKSDSAHQKAAWKLCKFIASPDFQVDWAIATGYLPISKRATNNPRYQRFIKQNDFIKTFSDQMPYARARPSVPAYQKISDEFSKAADWVFHGKMTAGKALDQAAKKANTYLK